MKFVDGFVKSPFAGIAPLRDGDNFWTAWIVPLGAMIFAVSFTDFYPDRATADPAPSWTGAIDWLPPFVMVTGIAGLVSDSVPAAVGVGCIVAGGAGTAILRKLDPSPASP